MIKLLHVLQSPRHFCQSTFKILIQRKNNNSELNSYHIRFRKIFSRISVGIKASIIGIWFDGIWLTSFLFYWICKFDLTSQWKQLLSLKLKFPFKTLFEWVHSKHFLSELLSLTYIVCVYPKNTKSQDNRMIIITSRARNRLKYNFKKIVWFYETTVRVKLFFTFIHLTNNFRNDISLRV